MGRGHRTQAAHSPHGPEALFFIWSFRPISRRRPRRISMFVLMLPSPSTFDDFRLLLRIGGIIACAMVCAPVVFRGGLYPRRFAPWIAFSLLFAAALWRSPSRRALATRP